MPPRAAPCPFCSPDAHRVAFEGEHHRIVWDGFPVSPGHALIVAKRHFGTWSDATREERESLMLGIEQAQAAIRARHTPDAFNIGINDGAAAGQTVPHLHVHVIPRYAGDVEDPRGGVRWVIAAKADYWSERKS